MNFRALQLIAILSAVTTISTHAQLFMAIGAGGADGQLYTVNPATADTTLIGNIQSGATSIPIKGLAFSPIDSKLYAVSANLGDFPHNLFTLDPTTGAATLIGDLTMNVGDISFNSSGTLFMWSGGSSDRLASINLTTGAATAIGPDSGTAFGAALAFSPSDTLYVSRQGASDGGTLQTVNTGTGGLTTGATLNGGPLLGGHLNSMAFSSGGTLYAIDDAQYHLVTINLGTGAIGDIGALPDNAQGLAFAPVPEPRDYAIVFSALCLGLAAFRRRTKSQKD